MKSVLLIGLGRFGRHMAGKLNEMNHEVLAIDINEQRGQRCTARCNQCADRRQHQ